MQLIYLMLKYFFRTGLIIAVLISLSIELSFPYNLRAEPLFSVKQHKFCRNIADLAPIDPYNNPTDIKKNESLWIWMEISINAKGYRFLEHLGKFPVYIAWGRDSRLVGKKIDIGITPEQWEINKQAITWKFNNSMGSSFTWRTYAVRESLTAGEYYVSVLDANRKPVTDSDDTVNSFRPRIKVNAVQK